MMDDEFSIPSFPGIEGGAAPSQAAPEDTSASEVSDGATACRSEVQMEQYPDTPSNAGRDAVPRSEVQMEQYPDTPSNAGRDAVPAVRQSHGAKRRGSRAKLDVDF